MTIQLQENLDNEEEISLAPTEKTEEFGWSYKDFKAMHSSPEDKLLSRPIMDKEGVRHCFVPSKKIKNFMETFKFGDYLFLSPVGTGKTSFLSYLSTLAIEKDYRPIWIMLYETVPTFSTLFKRLRIGEWEAAKTILVFDNIHTNKEIARLIIDIKSKFPALTIWAATRSYEFEKVKEAWEKIDFKREILPDYLEQGDILELLSLFKDSSSTPIREWLGKEEKKAILSHRRLPIIHLISLYHQLKNSGGKDALKIIKATPKEIRKVYETMYDSLDDEGRFALKLLSYLSGIEEKVLKAALLLFGTKEEIVDQLVTHKIIYKDWTYRIMPNLQIVETLNAFDELKLIVSSTKNTSEYELNHTFPNILLETDLTETLVALSDKYLIFDSIQKERYVQALLKKKEELPILYLVSRFAEYEDELLKVSGYALSRSANEKEGSFSRILHNFGYAYGIRENGEKEAITFFEKALSIYQDDPKAWYNLGVAYGKRREFKKAIDCCQKAIKFNADYAKAWYNLGIYYLNQQEPDKAASSYQKALKLDPVYRVDWYNLGVGYTRAKQWDKAILCYKKAADKSPGDSKAWHNLSVIYQGRNDYKEAIRCMREVVKLTPKDARAWYELGVLYGKIDQLNQVVDCYERAIKIDHEYEMDWKKLGTVYGQKGDLSKEIDCYERVVLSNPEDTGAWYDLGLLYGKNGDINRAIEAFEKAAKISPKEFKVWYNLGVAYGKMGDLDQEIESFKKAIAIDSEYPKIWHSLSTAYKEKKDTDQEINCLEKVAQLSPGEVKSWDDLARAYEAKGDKEKEKEARERAESLKAG